MSCRLAVHIAITNVNSQFAIIQRRVPGLQKEDPDALHDIRVASRRLRALLAEYAGLFEPTALNRFRELARAITRGLGEARQLDVSRARARELSAGANDGRLRAALNHLRNTLQRKRAALAPAVDKVVTQILSPRFHRACRTTAPVKFAKGCILERAEKRILKRHAAARDAYRKWKRGKTDPQLHCVRIACKKLRYTCETYRHVCGDALKTLAEDLKEVQDVLGDWHDWTALRNYVAEIAETASPHAAAGLPLLKRACDRNARASLRRFERMAPRLFNARQRRKTLDAIRPHIGVKKGTTAEKESAQ